MGYFGKQNNPPNLVFIELSMKKSSKQKKVYFKSEIVSAVEKNKQEKRTLEVDE